jgi:pimeloyl-ACP methyl ester carboxylesterase
VYSKRLKSIFTHIHIYSVLNKENTQETGVFENANIRFNYCFWGNKGMPMVFFAGFSERTTIYQGLLAALPTNVSLLVVETPLLYCRNMDSGLETGLIELLSILGLGKEIFLGGFSFGNWVATSLIQSKKLTVRAWILVSPSTPYNYRAFQLINNSYFLKTICSLLLKSKWTKKLLTQIAPIFVKSRVKRAFIIHLLQSESLLINYLYSSAPKYALRTQFIYAKSLKIPVLFLASINDPISSSEKTIDIGNAYSENARVFYIKSKTHTAFDKEFIKEIYSFLSGIYI